jgi:hypothetical protein
MLGHPIIEVVRLAVSSVICLSAAVWMLVVRGAANWSSAFAVVWFGVFGLAVALAVAALVVAGLSRGVTRRQRLTVVWLSLPALVAVPLLIWLIVTLAPLAN